MDAFTQKLIAMYLVVAEAVLVIVAAMGGIAWSTALVLPVLAVGFAVVYALGLYSILLLWGD